MPFLHNVYQAFVNYITASIGKDDAYYYRRSGPSRTRQIVNHRRVPRERAGMDLDVRTPREYNLDVQAPLWGGRLFGRDVPEIHGGHNEEGLAYARFYRNRFSYQGNQDQVDQAVERIKSEDVVSERTIDPLLFRPMCAERNIVVQPADLWVPISWGTCFSNAGIVLFIICTLLLHGVIMQIDVEIDSIPFASCFLAFVIVNLLPLKDTYPIHEVRLFVMSCVECVHRYRMDGLVYDVDSRGAYDRDSKLISRDAGVCVLEFQENYIGRIGRILHFFGFPVRYTKLVKRLVMSSELLSFVHDIDCRTRYGVDIIRERLSRVSCLNINDEIREIVIEGTATYGLYRCMQASRADMLECHWYGSKLVQTSVFGVGGACAPLK